MYSASELLRRLYERYTAWRTKRYWEKLQLENLRVINEDSRWLASNPLAAALTARYLNALAEDWYKLPREDVSQLRTRLGLAPNYKG